MSCRSRGKNTPRLARARSDTVPERSRPPHAVKNVSRCWTYETAVLLDMHQSLPMTLPHTSYDAFFAPDYKLHPDITSGRNRIENQNSRQALERIRVGILERLRYMHGAPSVQMQEVPPGLAGWLKDEDAVRDEDNDKTADERVGAGAAAAVGTGLDRPPGVAGAPLNSNGGLTSSARNVGRGGLAGKGAARPKLGDTNGPDGDGSMVAPGGKRRRKSLVHVARKGKSDLPRMDEGAAEDEMPDGLE